MARLDPRRLAWAASRFFLVHGAAAWGIAAGLACVLVALALLAGSLQRHAGLKQRWEARSVPGTVDPASDDAPGQAPLFPAYAERFKYTARALEALGIDGMPPGKAAFSWHRNEEPGLVTQTLAIQIQAPWEQLGAVLDRAQAELPTAYIAGLGLSREKGDDAVVEADVQFTLVYQDAPGGGGE